MAYFPLFLNLRNKQVLIIGESEAAFQELSRFLAFEANVTILTESVEQNLLLMSQAYPDQVRVVEKEISMEKTTHRKKRIEKLRATKEKQSRVVSAHRATRCNESLLATLF